MNCKKKSNLFWILFFLLSNLRIFSMQIKSTFTVGLIKRPLCTSYSCVVCILQPVGSCFSCVTFCCSFVIKDFALVLETSCVTMCHGALCGLMKIVKKTNLLKKNATFWKRKNQIKYFDNVTLIQLHAFTNVCNLGWLYSSL